MCTVQILSCTFTAFRNLEVKEQVGAANQMHFINWAPL